MNFIRKIMAGRYGSDQLSLALLGLYLVLYLIAAATGIAVLSLVALIPIAFSFYRIFSRNIEKRREENNQFLHFFAPVLDWFRTRRAVHKDREHRYFKCPNCGQQLRVPKGKGKITVTCRACGVSFEEKS